MAQTYAQFKTYFLAAIWRTNDTVVSNNLDTIINKATNELNQKTRDWDRRQITVVIAPDTEDFDLTVNVPDFEAVLSLVDNNSASRESDFKQATLATLYATRQRTLSVNVYPYYCIDRDATKRYLRLIGPFSVANPGDLTLMYRASLPDYSATDASWLEDEYLNLYENCVAKHAAMFVREDERIRLYKELFDEAWLTADGDDKHNLQFGGSALHMNPHRHVP